MPKKILLCCTGALLVFLTTTSAKAQYVDFTPRDQAVEVNLDILDNLPSSSDQHSRGIDCTTPKIAPVMQMPLDLTPPAQAPAPLPMPAFEESQAISAPPAPSAESMMRTHESAPVPDVNAEMAPPAPPAAPKPAGRVLKPIAHISDESYIAESTAPTVTDSIPTRPETVALPTPKPENYPAYMTQPGQVSTPSGAVSQHVALPKHKPEMSQESSAPISLLVEEHQPLPAQKPVEVKSEELPEMPAGIVETAPVLTEQEQKPIPEEDVTKLVLQDEEPVPAAVEEVAPAPEAAPIAEEPAPAKEYAAVPTVSDLSIEFQGNESTLTTDAQSKLKNILEQMTSMNEARLQVRAYASGEDGSKSSARRISLSRALAVRSFLMDNGIKPTRVDVRALGTETDRSPVDRVDLVFAR